MTPAEIIALVGALAAFVSSLAGLVVAIRTGVKVDSTHDLVNGQAGVMQVLSKQIGHAEGLAEGLAAQPTESP
jgi:hypothetical protein